MPSLLQLSFLLLTWLRASWSAGTPRLRCVRTDRQVYTSGGALLLSLSLVLQALLAPFRRLSLRTLSRESCLCTWRLTCLWTDVRIFLHLCILDTCRWDLIKDLSTWLALPLQHDSNIHKSVCDFHEFPYLLDLWHLCLLCTIAEISTTLSMN